MYKHVTRYVRGSDLSPNNVQLFHTQVNRMSRSQRVLAIGGNIEIMDG